MNLTPYGSEGSSIEEILFNITRQQKQYDDALAISKRLGIGGIIQVIVLSQDNIVIKNYKHFDDLGDTHIQILNNLNEN